MHRKLICFLLAMGTVFGFGATKGIFAKEKDFPSKPVELVCPWGAGGTVSMGGRVIAGTLAEYLKTPVVLIHKTGGGGSVAAAYVARCKPDGYTLLIFNVASNVIIPAIRSVEYTNADFEVLAQYLAQVLVLVVKNDAPWKTLEDLVADAKKNPGKLKFATAGIGTSSHFCVELFKNAAGGLKMGHVPFKSGPEIVAAILGGHVDMAILYLGDTKGAVEAGRLRMLAAAAEKRLDDYPAIPTFAELGYPMVKTLSWHGIAAPARLPKGVSEKLKDALAKTISHPEVKKMLVHLGYIPTYRKADEFTKYVAEEEKKFQRIAKEAGIKVE